MLAASNRTWLVGRAHVGRVRYFGILLAWIAVGCDGSAPPPTEGASAAILVAPATRHGADVVHGETLSDGITPIRGQGMVVGVLEPCVPVSHVDFGANGVPDTRLERFDVAHEYTWCHDPQYVAWQRHVMLVNGVIIGNAWGGEPHALGVAPAASSVSIVSLDSAAKSRLMARNAVALNHSSGVVTDCIAKYDSNSEGKDGLVTELGMSVVVAGGNQGLQFCPTRNDFSSIGSQSVTKNAISVGGLEDADNYAYTQGLLGPQADWFAPCRTNPSLCVTGTEYSMWVGSSRGPTFDGRIKPDLVAGEHVCATSGGFAGDRSIPGQCEDSASGAHYTDDNGTSIAAPMVSGIIALLHQVFRDENGTSPSPSLVRTLLAHTARDRGYVGPDFWYGWGEVDAKAAVDAVRADSDNAGTFLEEITLTPGQTRSFDFWVDMRPTVPYAPADGLLKITAGWIDPPGSRSAVDPTTRHDVFNDVDIVLVGPDGQEHYPWSHPYARSCDSSSGCDDTALLLPSDRTAANHVDNLEQIVFQLPPGATGNYVLKVKAPATLTGGSQVVSLAANHDVFLPPSTLTWRLCGPPFTTAGSCVTFDQIAAQLDCTTWAGVCIYTTHVARNTPLDLRLSAYAEAGLGLVEIWGLPPLTDYYYRYYNNTDPLPSNGQEVKRGELGGIFTPTSAGTYYFGGRVQRRGLYGAVSPIMLQIDVN